MERTYAALAALALFAFGIAPALAGTMTGEQIAQQIIGQELETSRNGMKVRLRYRTDGSVTMRAPIFSGEGTWALSGDELCMTLTRGPRQGITCHSFEDLGNGRYRNSEGLTIQAVAR
jgi:hypothetical protein